MRRTFAGPLLTICLLAGATAATAAPPDRSEIATFQRTLLAAHSATAVLTGWCASHHLADPPTVVALRRLTIDKPADAEVRRLLGAAPGEAVAYRRVDLDCGSKVLSRADNWYRPAALTPAMNATLASSDTPFGTVVKPLDFHRRTLDVRRPSVPGTGILQVRAVLVTAKGLPFALVQETYAEALLGPPSAKSK